MKVGAVGAFVAFVAFGAFVAFVAFVGCGRVGFATAPDAAGDAGTPVEHSGSSLKLVWNEFADGARQQIGIWDRVRGEMCQVRALAPRELVELTTVIDPLTPWLTDPVPELPDVTVYVERLRVLTVGRPLLGMRIASPFILRTVTPSPTQLAGAVVETVERFGKRIVIGLSGGCYVVIHLMIAGRLRWKEPGAKVPGKIGLVAFDFPNGTVIFTEASPKKRASLHLVAARAGLAEFDRGGLDVFQATAAQFAERLTRERHTVKRALTDPTLFDGIGNAYSDEILHAAKLSPFRMTSSITAEEIARLHGACIGTLNRWTELLREEVGEGFPDKVTAFRPEMAVHGKFGEPCPVCRTPVQRIVYADNEANYCPTCQTEGRLLADRALSRLLKEDWPRSLDELDERRANRVATAAAVTAPPPPVGPAAKPPKVKNTTAAPALGKKPKAH